MTEAEFNVAAYLALLAGGCAPSDADRMVDLIGEKGTFERLTRETASDDS